MIGVYRHCSKKHLLRHLSEFDFHYSDRVALGVDNIERTERAIKGAVDRQLIYRLPVSECVDRPAISRKAFVLRYAESRTRFSFVNAPWRASASCVSAVELSDSCHAVVAAYSGVVAARAPCALPPHT